MKSILNLTLLFIIPSIFSLLMACDAKEWNSSIPNRAKDGANGYLSEDGEDGAHGQDGLDGQNGQDGGHGGSSEWGRGGNGGNGGNAE